ncbi:MAG: thermonuclease family protein [Alphaproteobacteria bacterium]|nr:thermonuclease family protein [Alphaproteobacteria bacterium]
MKQKQRRRTKRPTGPKVWIATIVLVGVLFVIGDRNPQLRQALEEVLQELLTGEPPRARHAGAVRVVDGDTLDLSGTRVRLYGIDAPEGGQTCRRGRQDWACGAEATHALKAEIGSRDVTCEEQDIDRYGRVVGICHAGSRDLNAWMVRSGWAVAYRQYGGDLYDAEERVARLAQRGLWSSDFVMPWDWRRGQR